MNPYLRIILIWVLSDILFAGLLTWWNWGRRDWDDS
jgi:hypothetical protein